MRNSAVVPLPIAIGIVLFGIVLVDLKIRVLGSDVSKIIWLDLPLWATCAAEDIPLLDLTYREQYNCTAN